MAYSAFAHHYLRSLGWFLFLKVLRCFSSLGSCTLRFLHRSGFPLRIAMDLRDYAPPHNISSRDTSCLVLPRHPPKALFWLFAFLWLTRYRGFIVLLTEKSYKLKCTCPERLELSTSRAVIWHSIQLSYEHSTFYSVCTLFVIFSCVLVNNIAYSKDCLDN